MSGSLTPSSAPAAPPPPPPAPAHDVPGALRRDVVLVAIGVGFLVAAVVVAAANARPDGDLDWTSFGVGLLATVALLGTAAYARLGVRDAAPRGNLIVWPAAFGALASGLMTGVAIGGGDASAYVGSIVVIAVSAVAYAAVPGGALAVSGLVGLVALYLNLVDDLLDGSENGNGFVVAGVVVLVFTVAVTGLGWLLPRTRVLTGVVVGAFAVVAYIGIMVAIGFAQTLSLFLPSADAFGPSSDDPFTDSLPEQADTYTNDVWTLLVLALVLVGGWAVAAYLTQHSGFRVLIVVMLGTVVPAAAAALALEHPQWWALVTAVVGAAVLATIALRARTPRGPALPPPTVTSQQAATPPPFPPPPHPPGTPGPA